MMEMAGIALSWGMSYELYWLGDMGAIYSYYEKYKFERETYTSRIDTEAWLFGRYVMSAVGSVLGGENKYPKEPLSTVSKRSETDNLQLQYEKMKLWSSSVHISNGG